MKDLALLILMLGLMCLFFDWLQTVYIARFPLDFSETNPHLGPHPSVGAVCWHFLAWLVLILVLATGLLFLEWHLVMALAALTLVVIEGGFVLHNWRLGVGFGWED